MRRIGIGFGIPPFRGSSGSILTDPDTIANLAVWYDPDDATKYTLTAGKYSAVVNKAAGATASSNLTTRGTDQNPAQTSQNGRNWMNFNGSASLRVDSETTGSVNVGSTGYTLFVVVRTSNTGLNQTIINKGPTGSLYRMRLSSTNAGALAGIRAGATSGTVLVERSGSTVIANGVAHVACLTFDASSPFANTSYIDNVQDGATNSSTNDNINSSTADSAEFLVGAAPSTGTTTQNRFNGLIGEILLYKRLLTSTERASVQQYLAAKWGIGA